MKSILLKLTKNAPVRFFLFQIPLMIACSILVSSCGGSSSDYFRQGTTTPTPEGTPLTACGYLDRENTTYVLQNDVNSTGSCFAVIAPNVTLDLNGHTITYDNGMPVTVSNGDFEIGTGGIAEAWDQSNAPTAQRTAGTYVKPVSVYSRSYAMKFSVPAVDQYIRCSVPVTLQPDTTYSLTGMVYNQAGDDITISVELERTSVKAEKTGKTWRGFQYIYAPFTTGSTIESRTILVRLSGASGASAGNVYVDDIKIQRHKLAGVVIGPASWRIPNIVSDVNRYGNAPGVTIRNGKIIQGQGASDYSHAISLEENSGSDFEINDLDISVHGANSKAISSYNADNARVHDNTIHHNTNTITSRDGYDGAAIKIEYQSWGSLFFSNVISTGIQTGIYANSKAGQVPNQIFGNNITLQTKYTNDFAIVGNGSEIYENVVNCGSGNSSCRGIWAGGTGTKVYNNTISVQQLPRNQEYNGCEASGAYGIQSESANDVEVYGNTVTANAGECEAHAMRANPFNGTVMGQNTYIHDNSFTAIASGSARASAIKIAEADAGSLDIRNNTLVSNRHWLHFDGHAVGLVFTGNTFKTATPLDSPFYPFTDYNWNTTIYPDTITFLDNRYPNDITATLFTDSSFRNGSSIDPYASFLYAWSLQVGVKNSSNLPIAGASIEIRDTNGVNVFTGVTDSDGIVLTTLVEFSNVGGVKTEKNPYSLVISKDGANASKEIVIKQPMNVEVTIE